MDEHRVGRHRSSVRATAKSASASAFKAVTSFLVIRGPKAGSVLRRTILIEASLLRLQLPLLQPC
jgi:hypothetical protein